MTGRHASPPGEPRAPRSHYPAGSAWRRGLSSLVHEHPRTFLLKLLAELGYRRVVLLARPLDEPIEDGPGDPGVTFARLAEDRLDAYVAFRGNTDRGAVEASIAGGRECHVLEREGRIVSSCWASTVPQWSGFLGSETPLADGDVYFSDAWTDPAHRGRAYAHILCLHQLRHFRDRGFRRGVRSTVPENRSALRAHAKSGFRPVEIRGTIRLGPWRRSFRRPWRGRFP